MSKVDEVLTNINIFLSTTTDRITPNVILFVTAFNGFILGFLTTGYLGLNSMGIFSFPFWLFIEQFVVICFFSSRYVDLTTEYLTKFFLAGVIGYYVQWQSFGVYVAEYEPEMLKHIQPVLEGGSGNFIFILFLIMGVKHCFSGNEVKQRTKINTDIQ
jgi:hypothetical protein